MNVKPFFCILVCAGCLSSCHNDHSSTKQVFRYNESSNIVSLDPAFAKSQSVIWAVHQLYNTLVETDSDLHVVPSLATRWTISPDRLTYTFYLRRDVFFHDNDAFPGGKGRLMTAHDVAFSFGRISDPRTASSGAWIFHNRVAPDSGFRALNDSVFCLRLLRPFTPVLGLLSMQYCSVVPREVAGKYGKDFSAHACGTGPFQLHSWEEGQALILAKNSRYFERDPAGRRLPYLDAVKVSFFNSKATEFLLFRQGKLDFINDIDASFKDEVLNKKGRLKKEWQGRVVLSTHPYLNTEYLGFLMRGDALKPGSPLRSRQVRQAINYGFDRRKLMMYLRNSLGTPAESGFIPKGFPSFDTALVKGYSYDPVKARALLADAGFPNGRGIGPIRLTTVAVYADLAGLIAKDLESIGLSIQVEVVQKTVLLEQTARSQVLFFRGSWIADYPDAENYLSVFYGRNPAPPNYTRYQNAAFDRLYEQALVTTNDTARYDLYRQMDRLVMADAPVVPLWYDEVIRLVGPRVSGFRPNGLNLLELRTTRVH